MKPGRRLRRLQTVLGCLVAALLAASSAVPVTAAQLMTSQRVKEVTAATVWTPSPAAERQLFGPCNAGTQCALSVMRSSGASSDAIAFASKHNSEVYVSEYRPFGVVDLAQLSFTHGTNFQAGYLLVNGTSGEVQVEITGDDGELNAALDADPDFATVKAAHPIDNVSQFSEERVGWLGEDMLDSVQVLPDGSETFIFASPIKAAHAGTPDGLIYVGYEFDMNGVFLGKVLDHVVAF
jgi:hypothetical protein